MISLTTEEQEKLEIVDRLLTLLDKDQLEEVLSELRVMHKLRSDEPTVGIGPIMALIDKVEHQEQEIVNLKNEMAQFRDDVVNLVRLLNQARHGLNQSGILDNLINKHGVY